MSNEIENLKLSKPGIIPVDLWNRLVALVGSSLITSFCGGTFARTEGGTALIGLPGGSVDPVIYPWQMTPICETNDDDELTGKIQIQYGEIDSTPPDGMTDDGSGDTFAIDPLDGTNGTSWLYIILTFDAVTRKINSRTIGYTTSSGEDVPDNTDDTKYFIIGQVQFTEVDGDAPGFYTVLSQEITQNIFTDQVTYHSDGENTLFADENLLELVDTTYTARLESSSLTITDYPIDDGSGDGEQILLEINDEGTASIHGQAGGDGGATFDLVADDVSGEASLTLDDGSNVTTTLNTTLLDINDDNTGNEIKIELLEGGPEIKLDDQVDDYEAIFSADRLSLDYNPDGVSAASCLMGVSGGDAFLEMQVDDSALTANLALVEPTGLAHLSMADTVGTVRYGTEEIDLADMDGNTVTISCPQIVLYDSGSGNTVTLDVPPEGSVGWQPMTDPCTGYTMKVFGTPLTAP